jgi:glycosyltransferase involved in cell wall biosynthesis
LIFRRLDQKLKLPLEQQIRRSNTVSAVISTHSRPQLTERAVRNALVQEYDDLEVVVVVDGPDRATENALADVLDKRLRVIVLPRPVGVARARNLGVTAAWGDWIAFLDDDYEWLPEKTMQQMNAAQNSEYLYPIVSSQLIARTSRDELLWHCPLPFKPIGKYVLSGKIRPSGEVPLATITLLLPKDLFRQMPFQTGLARHQDWDWMSRIIECAGAGIEFASKPLVVWHQAKTYESTNLTGA